MSCFKEKVINYSEMSIFDVWKLHIDPLIKVKVGLTKITASDFLDSDYFKKKFKCACKDPFFVKANWSIKNNNVESVTINYRIIGENEKDVVGKVILYYLSFAFFPKLPLGDKNGFTLAFLFPHILNMEELERYTKTFKFIAKTDVISLRVDTCTMDFYRNRGEIDIIFGLYRGYLADSILKSLYNSIYFLWKEDYTNLVDKGLNSSLLDCEKIFNYKGD